MAKRGTAFGARLAATVITRNAVFMPRLKLIGAVLINSQLNSSDVVKPVAGFLLEKGKNYAISVAPSRVHAMSAKVIRQLLANPFIITWLSRAAKKYAHPFIYIGLAKKVQMVTVKIVDGVINAAPTTSASLDYPSS